MLSEGGKKEGPDTGESGPLFVFRSPRRVWVAMILPWSGTYGPHVRLSPGPAGTGWPLASR